jgi:hypothetical protein
MQRARPDRGTTELTDDGSSRLLIATGWTLWDNALLFIVCSLLLLCVLVPFVIVASVAGWLFVWAPMVLVAAPIWLGTVSVSDRLLDGKGVRARDLPVVIRKRWRVAVQLALVPAMLGALALGLLESSTNGDSASIARLLIPGASSSLLAAAVLIGPAFAFAARTNAGARDAWVMAARQVVSRPVQQVGLVVCFGVLLWLAAVIGPALLLGLAPLAVLTAALARGATSGIATLDNSDRNRRP